MVTFRAAAILKGTPLGTPLYAPTLPQRQATEAMAADLDMAGLVPANPDNRALCHPDRDRRDKPGD